MIILLIIIVLVNLFRETSLVVMATIFEKDILRKTLEGFKFPYTILITGIGPVRAATALTAALMKFKYKRIINIGLAGNPMNNLSKSWYSISTVHNINYESPEEPLPPINLQGLTQIGTSEKFIRSSSEIPEKYRFLDLIDMELYSLAYVAQLYKIPIVSYKFLSDSGSYEEYSNINVVEEKLEILDV